MHGNVHRWPNEECTKMIWIKQYSSTLVYSTWWVCLFLSLMLSGLLGVLDFEFLPVIEWALLKTGVISFTIHLYLGKG